MSPASPDTVWIGFDLGGTKMLATVYDEAFKPLGSKKKRTKGHRGQKTGLERMCETIDGALEAAGASRKAIRGIGIGCPGPLDLEKGVVLEAPNLGWEKVPVKKTIEAEFKCPAVVANDVDVGVYGEYRFGAGRGARCVLGIFPGTGIGGGCIYEGNIFRGRRQSCMEIGHVQLLAGGARSGTGQVGSLEATSSRLAIAGAAVQAAYRGQAPHLLENAGTDLAEVRSGALAAAIKAGDTVVERIVRDAAEYLGIAMAGAIHLLAPDVVVLGGGLVEAMPELILKEVRASARKVLLPTFAKSLKVVPAELGDDAAVLGAAAWVAHVQAGETS